MRSKEEASRGHEYELGHSDWELKRLQRQARLVDPFTMQFFRDAGVAPGMRILDFGSGAGDVSLLVAELVGETGEVVGIDAAPLAVTAAWDRIKALGKPNISFRHADLDSAEFAGAFDAAVGRYVLMFNPDPALILRSLARLVRPGGVIVFHEVDWNGSRSNPVAPMCEQCCDWIVRTFKKVGTNPHMGQDLHAAFVLAELPAPSMALRALIGGPPGGLNYVELIAELAITMMPAMEEHCVIARGEIDPANYARRMREEVQRLDSLVVGRSEIGAWSRVP